MMKREDYESPPTVVGKIVAAWIGEDGEPDIMHVQGTDEANDVGTLLRIMEDEENPNPHRPFCLFGQHGTFALHGYTDATKLIGKNCLIYATGRFETVAIEPDKGDDWGLVVWTQFV